MSVYKAGKNRQIDTMLPQKLKSTIRWIIQDEYRIRLGIFYYIPDIHKCWAKGHDKDSPLGKLYRTPWDTRRILTGRRGELLGIIENYCGSDERCDSVGEFYWFNDVSEYTEEEYKLMDNDEWDDPCCPYSYGVNKRIPIFV